MDVNLDENLFAVAHLLAVSFAKGISTTTAGESVKRLFERLFPDREERETAAPPDPGLADVERIAERLDETVRHDDEARRLAGDLVAVARAALDANTELARLVAERQPTQFTGGDGATQAARDVNTYNGPVTNYHAVPADELPGISISTERAAVTVPPTSAAELTCTVSSSDTRERRVLLEVNCPVEWLEVEDGHRRDAVVKGGARKHVAFSLRIAPGERPPPQELTCYVNVLTPDGARRIDYATVAIRVDRHSDLRAHLSTSRSPAGAVLPVAVELENLGNVTETGPIIGVATGALTVQCTPEVDAIRPGEHRPLLLTSGQDPPWFRPRHGSVGVTAGPDQVPLLQTDATERPRIPVPVSVGVAALVLLIATLFALTRPDGRDPSTAAPSTRPTAGATASTPFGGTTPGAPGSIPSTVPATVADDPVVEVNTAVATDLVVRYVTALAGGDLETLRRLEPTPTPAHEWDRSYLDQAYPDTIDATARPAAASRVSDAELDLLVALVVHEGDGQVERTREFCADFRVDVDEGVVDQLDGVQIADHAGEVDADELGAGLIETCRSTDPAPGETEQRFASDRLSVVVPGDWGHRADDRADEWQDPDGATSLRVEPVEVALGTEEQVTAEACGRDFGDVVADDVDPVVTTVLTEPTRTTIRDREPCVFEYRRSDGSAVVVYELAAGQWVFTVRAASATDFRLAQRAASRAAQTLTDLSPAIDCSAGCE